MGLEEIIGIIIGIPVFIFIVIPMIFNFFVEGVITEALLNIFGVNPIIIGFISFCCLLCFIIIIVNIAGSIF